MNIFLGLIGVHEKKRKKAARETKFSLARIFFFVLRPPAPPP